MNRAVLLLLGGGLAILLWLYGWPAWRRCRRARQPVDPAWPLWLADYCGWYRRLTLAKRSRLHRMMGLFIEQVTFVGLGGLQVTDTMRLKIAAEACRMLLGRGPPVFPSLGYVYLYPGPWRAHIEEEGDDGVVHEGEDERSGETWHEGRVFLAWDDIKNDIIQGTADDAVDTAAAYHLIAHEFAHVLDHEWGLTTDLDAEGNLPGAGKKNAIRAGLGSEYRALCAARNSVEALWLDEYAMSDPAEFFAVASEAYFACPGGLKAARPTLYELLKRIYQDGE